MLIEFYDIESIISPYFITSIELDDVVSTIKVLEV